jgi:hypothetical protein
MAECTQILIFGYKVLAFLTKLTPFYLVRKLTKKRRLKMTAINDRIDEANNLIKDLREPLAKFGTFDYNVLMKGKENPVVILEIAFARDTNVISKPILKTVESITSKNYFNSFKKNEKDILQLTINIVI